MAVLFLLSAGITFILTYLILKKLIPVLKGKKMGQVILDIGPRWHKGKEGTPTMGGISFIIASVLTGGMLCLYLALTGSGREALILGLTVALGLAGGLIGCIDDYAKLRNRRNEGLTPVQKFSLQLLSAVLFVLALRFFADFDTTVYIPFFGVTADFGFFFYVFAVILICGIMNSTNLTDGIDGLSSSVTLIVGVFFSLVGFLSLAGEEYRQATVILGGLLIGSCAGFLIYNFYPARVFMGDTGSIFLGGAVVAGSFMIRNPLLVIVFGIIYIIETVSVMLQVLYFKATHGKRLFKMAPIHHHFEKSGWSEVKIVIVFSAVTAVFAALSLLGF